MKSAPLLLALVSLCITKPLIGAEPNPGTTQVLKWKDGKKACFMLAFDDSAPSQIKNAIPELEKRKLVGTFYLVTGNSLYAGLKPKWEEAAKSPSVVVANHTSTHKGVTNAEELEPELAKCNEVLYTLHPDRPLPRLLAFGKPGGVPWIVTKEDQAAALARHNLIDRPPFAGPPLSYKTVEQSIAVIDRALEKGEMGHLDFHGVGGDWLTTPMDWFTALLDKIEANRDAIWVTDCVSWHQYVKERDAAEIKIVEVAKDRLAVQLDCGKLDAKLYNLPLTLSTRVPANWKSCVVEQHSSKTTVPVKDGVVQYSAVPSGGTITLQSAPL